jgi:hypothetical protein
MNFKRTRIALLWSSVACLVLLGWLRGSTAGLLSQGLTPSTESKTYLPLVYKNRLSVPPTFGVQMSAIDNAHGLQQAVEGGVHWVRYEGFQWDQIEPLRTIPASYDWQTVDEESLSTAYANNLTLLAEVLYAPQWAQKYWGSACGPIDPGQLDRYAAFLEALVRRYKDPPYNVKYWELGNEPDVKVSYQRRPYGCWGESGQDTFGGEAYGEMLKVAYPAIKAADPQAKVLIGGLLLDCDPTHPPAGQSCASARFLEGILDAGAGDAFDIVSFHGYAHWDGVHAVDEDNPYWQDRGGVVLGKAHYLREVMQRYGVDKPLMHTEGSLIYSEDKGGGWTPPGATFYDAQADYVVRLYVRNWANGIDATIWFTFEGPGWRYGSLLDAQQAPKPAYDAFQFLTRELGGAWFDGPLTVGSDLEGYAFATLDKQIWVLWPPQRSTRTLALPPGVTRVYDKLGREITPPGSTLSVTGPVYIEIAP